MWALTLLVRTANIHDVAPLAEAHSPSEIGAKSLNGHPLQVFFPAITMSDLNPEFILSSRFLSKFGVAAEDKISSCMTCNICSCSLRGVKSH